jgi:hypothetical protein
MKDNITDFGLKYATPDRHFSFPEAYSAAGFDHGTSQGLGNNPNLSDSHIEHIVGGHNFDVRKTLARSMPQKHIDSVIGDKTLHTSLAMNPNLSEKHFSRLFKDSYTDGVVKTRLLENPSLPKSLMNEHLAKNDPFIDMDLAGNPSLPKEHMHTILDRENSNSIAILASNPTSSRDSESQE